MSWLSAIARVLRDSNEAIHYTQISDEIRNRELRKSLGATPQNTVNAYLTTSINKDGQQSPFERTGPGYYRWKRSDKQSSEPITQIADESPELEQQQIDTLNAEGTTDTTGLINALGMYWARDLVLWQKIPRLHGIQTVGSDPIDFSDERGVYLLYDRNSVIYVGRAIDQGIGTRLKQHTVDRLSSRWDRFSWFGVNAVSPDGSLQAAPATFNLEMLIATMEALLIESVEPRQNRRRGDDFRAVEFIQSPDPEIEKNRILAMMEEFKRRILPES